MYKISSDLLCNTDNARAVFLVPYMPIQCNLKSTDNQRDGMGPVSQRFVSAINSLDL